MKKLISLVLILCMACALIPAMAEETAGLWGIINDSGNILLMNLLPDGTATVIQVNAGQEDSGTWTEADGRVEVTVQGDTIGGAIQDGTLVLGRDDYTMSFNKGSDDICGEWYVHYLSEGGKLTYLPSSGYIMKLTIRDDGTIDVAMTGEEEVLKGSWTVTDGVVRTEFSSNTYCGAVIDGILAIGSTDRSLLLLRDVPENISLADVNPQAVAADFEGTWNIRYVGKGDMIVDPTISGEAMPTLIIENSTMTAVGEDSFSKGFGGYALPLTYADGALSIEAGGVLIKAELLQDGMLALTLRNSEQTVRMFFIKAE